MAFDDFEKSDVESFIERHADPQALWLFLHIPKTAGSSFGSEMAQLLSPYRNIHVNYEDRAQPYYDQLRLAVSRFLVEARQIRYRSASGHVPYTLVDRIVRDVPRAQVVTILRDPVARIISDYRYQRTPAHPPYLEFIQRYPTIESYLADENEQNKMFSYMAPPGVTGDFNSAYAEIRRRFTFIGLLEMYPMSFNILFRLFGQGDRMPVEHQRKTVELDQNRVAVTPQLIGKIKELNALDVQLFEAVRQSLVSQRQAWVDYRERDLRQNA